MSTALRLRHPDLNPAYGCDLPLAWAHAGPGQGPLARTLVAQEHQPCVFVCSALEPQSLALASSPHPAPLSSWLVSCLAPREMRLYLLSETLGD